MSNRRLQQLINITTLTDDCKSKESEKEAKKKRRNHQLQSPKQKCQGQKKEEMTEIQTLAGWLSHTG